MIFLKGRHKFCIACLGGHFSRKTWLFPCLQKVKNYFSTKLFCNTAFEPFIAQFSIMYKLLLKPPLIASVKTSSHVNTEAKHIPNFGPYQTLLQSPNRSNNNVTNPNNLHLFSITALEIQQPCTLHKYINPHKYPQFVFTL